MTTFEDNGWSNLVAWGRFLREHNARREQERAATTTSSVEPTSPGGFDAARGRRNQPRKTRARRRR